jgi:hypothetical protein
LSVSWFDARYAAPGCDPPGMTEHAEIRGRLVMDDAATGALEHIAHGLELIEHKAKHVGGELTGMLKQSVATALGFQFDRGLHTLKEIGEEAFEAAKGAGAEEKALAGVLMMVDKAGKSYADLKAEGAELKEQLEDMAIGMGASTERVIDVFGDIAARSQKSTEQIKDLVGQLVNVGKVAPGGFDALAQGMMQLEMGISRARNPVVQFIAQTNVLSDHLHKTHMNAKEVSKYMTKLAPESQLKLAEEAIERMNARTKDIPLTFGQLVQSAKDIREQVFEKMGLPILREAFTPAMKDAQAWLVKHREEMEHFATGMGHKIADWIKDGTVVLKDGFQWVVNHSDQIKQAFQEAAHFLKEAVKFAIDHKEIIAVLVGARAVQTSGIPKVMGAVESMAPLAKGALQGGGALWEAVKAGAPSVGVGAAGSNAAAFVPFATAVGAFAAAVLSWKLAIDQWKELQGITGGGKSEARMDFEAREKYLREVLAKKLTWSPEELAQFDAMRAKMVENAAAAGKSAREVGANADALWAQHMAAKRNADELTELAKRANDESQFPNVGDYAGTGEDTGTNLASERWMEIYGAAKQSHDQAIVDYAVGVLASSETLQNGLLVSKKALAGGFGELADALSQLSTGVGTGAQDFAKILRSMKPDEALKGGASKPLTLNFNGNSFHIKQDFRNADPDKTLLMFKEDLAKQTVFRTGSRLSSPFGL